MFCFVKNEIGLEAITSFSSPHFDYSIHKLNNSGKSKYIYCIYRSQMPLQSLVFLLSALKLRNQNLNSVSERTILGDYYVQKVEWLTFLARTDDAGLEG